VISSFCDREKKHKGDTDFSQHENKTMNIKQNNPGGNLQEKNLQP